MASSNFKTLCLTCVLLEFETLVKQVMEDKYVAKYMLCKIQRTSHKASYINWKISVQTGRIYVQSPLYLSMKKSRDVTKCGHSYSSEQTSNCTVTLNHLSRRNLHRCKPYSCKPLIR